MADAIAAEPAKKNSSKERQQPDDENLLFRLSTTEGVVLKNLCERLRRFKDCSFEFRKSGVFMSAMNESISCLTQLSLNSLNDYQCEEEKLVGLDTPSLFDVLKTANKDEHITILMAKPEATDDPVVSVTMYDPSRETETNYWLRTLELDHSSHDMPARKFDVILSIPSAQFQRALRQCASAGSRIRIYTTVLQKEMMLVFDASDASSRAAGTSAARVRVTMTLPADHSKIKECKPNTCYSLDLLLEAARSGTMSPGGMVVISLAAEDCPLVIDHQVGTMGTLRHCILPLLYDDAEDMSPEEMAREGARSIGGRRSKTIHMSGDPDAEPEDEEAAAESEAGGSDEEEGPADDTDTEL